MMLSVCFGYGTSGFQLSYSREKWEEQTTLRISVLHIRKAALNYLLANIHSSGFKATICRRV
jgi:hypothetical protein